MFCKNCGKEIENGAAFCGECGTKVQPVGDPIDATPEIPISGQSAAEPTLSAEPVQPAAQQSETPVYTAPAQPPVQPAAQSTEQPFAQPFAQPAAQQQPFYAAQPDFGAPAAAKKPVYKQWWFYTAIAAAVAVVVAVVIIFLSASSPAGTWKVRDFEINGQKFTISEIEKLAATGLSDELDADSVNILKDMRLELKSDGKAYLTSGDNEETMDWEETDDGVKIDEIECNIDDGVMCLEESYSGLKIYFEKD